MTHKHRALCNSRNFILDTRKPLLCFDERAMQLLQNIVRLGFRLFDDCKAFDGF